MLFKIQTRIADPEVLGSIPALDCLNTNFELREICWLCIQNSQDLLVLFNLSQHLQDFYSCFIRFQLQQILTSSCYNQLSTLGM